MFHKDFTNLTIGNNRGFLDIFSENIQGHFTNEFFLVLEPPKHEGYYYTTLHIRTVEIKNITWPLDYSEKL